MSHHIIFASDIKYDLTVFFIMSCNSISQHVVVYTDMLHYTILFEPISILHCVDSCTLTILRHMILIIYIYI